VQAQLAWLVEEVSALSLWATRLPDWLLEGRPLEEAYTVKELYGLIAARDAQVCAALLEPLQRPADFTGALADGATLVAAEPWNTYPFPHILERLQQTRTRLVAQLQALPPEAWTRSVFTAAGGAQDLYTLCHALIQQEADLLREVASRLHESHLSARPTALPT
jgi:hypothetical protein